MGDIVSTPSAAERRAARLRDFLLRSFAIAVAAGVPLFLILRVGAPWLVNLHDTAALWLAAGLLLLCPVIAGLAAFRFWEAWRRWRAHA